ncbi:MAG: YgjP-like metallopeptidase domain-containing protein [Pseudomonadota bacterium]
MTLSSRLYKSQDGWYYTLRRSSRARKLRLQYCRDEGLSLVLPMRASRADADAFLYEQRAWIRRCHEADPQGLDRPREAPDCPDRVLLLATEQSIEVPGHYDALKLQARVHDCAREVLPAWVDRLSERTGLCFKRVCVRNQRARWGSYSSRGTVSLNWRLVLLTSHMVDYVVLHELAHSRVMNHSQAFWRVLESVCPNARARDRSFDRDAARLIPPWARFRASA